MSNLTEKEKHARKRIYLALDNMGTVKAVVETVLLSNYIGGVKVGKELHIRACKNKIDIFDELYKLEEGVPVFADLKLHDTPNTVYQASKELAVPGVYMFNVHISGGEEMCKSALEGAIEGARYRKIKIPKVIGVTELTSLNDSDLETQRLGIKYDDLVRRRTELAREWKLDGIVCPANKAGKLEKEFGSDFLYVTPGVQWKGVSGKGQKQLYTPGDAVRDCSNSILIIGSAITKAENPEIAAHEILEDMAKNL